MVLFQNMHQLHHGRVERLPKPGIWAHDEDNISGPDLGQQSMTLCRLTLFTRSPDQPENRADVRVLIRIAGVADIDHVYRRPADPAHVCLLQQGGVCIFHDPV